MCIINLKKTFKPFLAQNNLMSLCLRLMNYQRSFCIKKKVLNVVIKYFGYTNSMKAYIAIKSYLYLDKYASYIFQPIKVNCVSISSLDTSLNLF